MRSIRLLPVSFFVLVLLLVFSSGATAQGVPKALRGKIITSYKPINIPGSAKGFARKLKKQDKKMIRKQEGGTWVIYFVAFFNRSLPSDSMGVVVLDGKGEPVAVADVKGQKGQTSLASQITVDSTEFPGKKHTVQVYYAKGKKPVILAKKQVVLKK